MLLESKQIISYVIRGPSWRRRHRIRQMKIVPQIVLYCFTWPVRVRTGPGKPGSNMLLENKKVKRQITLESATAFNSSRNRHKHAFSAL